MEATPNTGGTSTLVSSSQDQSATSAHDQGDDSQGQLECPPLLLGQRSISRASSCERNTTADIAGFTC